MENINVIDIEASGLGEKSYPIEVAINLAGELHSWLIKPEADWTHWDEKAEALHGISRARLLHDGLELKIVVEKISQLLSTSTNSLYSDAQKWDTSWLHTLFRAADAIPDFDILAIQDLMNERQFDRYAKKFEELEHSDEYQLHRAGPDAEMIYQSFCAAMDIE